MPMFPTPKPRQFHYSPWYYDPKKEDLEKVRRKYEKAASLSDESTSDVSVGEDSSDVEYFEKRLRELDHKDREASRRLNASDLFRKREMPKFHYTPRYDVAQQNDTAKAEATDENQTIMQRIRQHKIRHRFDMDSTDYFKPIPAGKIMIYTIAVLVMLLWVIL